MRPILLAIREIFGVFFDVLMLSGFISGPPLPLPLRICFFERNSAFSSSGRFGLDDSIRFTLARLSLWFDWRSALIVVKPDTLVHWHRKGLSSVLEMEVPPSAGLVCADVRKLIAEMATSNLT